MFVNVFVVVAVLGLAYLAVIHPFKPGHALFEMQQFAERMHVRLARDPQRSANLSIDLAERRLADLAYARDVQSIQLAGAAFNTAMVDVAGRMDVIEAQEMGELQHRLNLLLTQTKIILETIDPFLQIDVIKVLYDRVQMSINMPEARLHKRIWSTLITPQLVQFYSGEFTPADHTTYQLAGHYTVECMACHSDGLYKGTPRECEDCHEAPSQTVRSFRNISLSVSVVSPGLNFETETEVPHYLGRCVDCHHTYSWEPFAFDHQIYTDCLSCHEKDLPSIATPFGFSIKLFHYDGECMDCHKDVSSWSAASFDHTGRSVNDCYACHKQEVASAHFPDMACTSCHVAGAQWSALAFDHSNASDCKSCHDGQQALNHFTGQCSNCHTTASWESTWKHPSNPKCLDCHQDIDFHKGNTECQYCHMATAFHYPGKCDECHTQKNWVATKFDHGKTKYSDCSSCHRSETAHYPGQCSQCHSKAAWSQVDVQHSKLSQNCLECHNQPGGHYVGACTLCHSDGSWQDITPDHGKIMQLYGSCTDCHSSPIGHYTGTCTLCHGDSSWTDININHTDIMASYGSCTDCHSSPTGHYPGTCTLCHGDSSWTDINVNHTEIMASYGSCTDCHATPQGHWPGVCSNCHFDYEDWNEVKFDHTGYSNCNACHTNIRPSGHPRGMCSNCHTTDSWKIVTPTPDSEEQDTDPVDVVEEKATATPDAPEPLPTLVTPEPGEQPVDMDEQPTEIAATRTPKFTPTPLSIQPTAEPLPPEQASAPRDAAAAGLDIMTTIYLAGFLLLTTGTIRLYFKPKAMVKQ
jgi:hypothetical protein